MKSCLLSHCQLSAARLTGGLLLSGTALFGFLPSAIAAPVVEQAAAKQTSAPSLLRLLDTIPNRQTVPQTAPAENSTGAAANDAEMQPIKLLLRLSERRVYVMRGDTVETSYPVAVGRAGWETPTGEFEVFHQLENPGWTNPITSEVMPPGPNNPLGDRWIAFWTDGNNSIGFHGTPNRESVGTAASHGCIRMYNEDVRELYDIVSVGTIVAVEP